MSEPLPRAVGVVGLGLLVGVDRLLDMARTTVNVAGDLVLAAVVARGAAPLPGAAAPVAPAAPRR